MISLLLTLLFSTTFAQVFNPRQETLQTAISCPPIFNPDDLAQAIRDSNTPLVKCFLDKNNIVNEKDSSAYSPLIWATYKGFDEIVNILVDKGCDVNTLDPHGNSAVIMASKIGHNKIIMTLVDKGADIFTTNDEGLNALYYARATGNDLLAVFLMQKGLRWNNS